MKQFACGDVVPGCDATFTEIDDQRLMAAVTDHARDHHGMTTVPPELAEQVRRRIVTLD